jgi:hypothetical protein
MNLRALFSIGLAVVLSAVAAPASAQSGGRCQSACHPPYSYHGGSCTRECAPGAPCSHMRAECNDGLTLNRTTGICEPPGGCGGECEDRPACTRKGSTYLRDSDRGEAVCGTRSGLGWKAHELVPCPEGFSLVPGRGICRRCPIRVPVKPLPFPRPDLIFRMVQLGPHGAPVSSVHRGHPYYVCFIVANVGAVASGPFRVAGGGLGIPTIPFQNHAGLAVGAERKGCLLYPTTPAAGKYVLGLQVDSLNAVAESNEGNNTRNIPVLVVP